MRALASIVVTGVLLVPSPALPQGVRPGACACTPGAPRDLGTGVVWAGAERLGVRDIASLTAPVLWFSADEPLLNPDHVTIPSAHPCDAPADVPVVYYQVMHIVYRGSEPVTMPVEDDQAFMDKVETVVLRFFFYYPEDFGVGGHLHDLESIEVEIALDREGACRRVRVDRIEGLAHGSRWYSNILQVQPDVKFPITVFVEEGKHASAPDRNADGHFMRGYDVTTLINDAWGVRDSLGQGVLLTAGYNPEMIKPRSDRYRLLPPEEPRLCVPPRRSSLAGRESLGHYALRPADRVPVCTAAVAPRVLEQLRTEHKFGQGYEPNQYRTGDIRADLSRLDSPDQLFSFSLRKVPEHVGAAVVIRGFDLREGWLVPRLTVDGVSASGEMMFTRSASRWYDVYLSAGARRQFSTVSETRTIETQNGEQQVAVLTTPNWDGVIELGVKFRANIPARIRPFVLGYHFGGMRLGLRGLGFPTILQWQFVWELGAGAW